MKDTVSRVGRITKYVVVPAELITPVSDVAVGAVVKVTKVVGAGPVSRQTAKVRSSVAQVKVTRLHLPRRRRSGGAASGPEPAPAPSPDAPDASDAPGSST